MKRANLDREYILNHLDTVHTYESWGRALVGQILDTLASRQDVEGSSAGLDIAVTVSATERGCIRVCVGNVCVHVSSDILK